MQKQHFTNVLPSFTFWQPTFTFWRPTFTFWQPTFTFWRPTFTFWQVSHYSPSLTSSHTPLDDQYTSRNSVFYSFRNRIIFYIFLYQKPIKHIKHITKIYTFLIVKLTFNFKLKAKCKKHNTAILLSPSLCHFQSYTQYPIYSIHMYRSLTGNPYI